MTYKYIFDPAAIDELEESLIWYGERSIKLADDFNEAVKNKIDDICRSPRQYRSSYKKYRETSLNKFPFSIVYLVNEEQGTIVITSIYHHKRNPKRKYKK
jgi:plasmid stabilization system protein ParE